MDNAYQNFYGGKEVYKPSSECHLKGDVGPLLADFGWGSQYKVPFGFCSDNKTRRIDSEGSNCSTTFPITHFGLDFPGNDLTGHPPMALSTLGDCEQRCKDTAGCKLFSFLYTTPYLGTCHLKSSADGERSPNALYVSKPSINYGKCWDGVTLKNDEKGTNCPPLCPDGFTGKVGDGSNCPPMCDDGKTMKLGDGNNCNYAFTPPINDYFPFNDIKNYPNKTKDECMAICKSTPDCGGFSMNTAGTCWVKNKNMVNGRVPPNPSETAYLLAPFGLCTDKQMAKRDASGSNCKAVYTPRIKTGFFANDNAGYDTGYPTGDEATCKKVCKNHPDCNGFAISTKENRCFLKNKIEKREGHADWDSFILAKHGLCADKINPKLDAEGTNCSMTMLPVKTETSIEGNDMFDYSMSSVTDCFNTCKSTAGFKAVNMDSETGTHCYIKNSLSNQESNRVFDTYEVAPFGLCDDKTVKIDSLGTNCPGLVTPAPTVTVSPTDPPEDDGVYSNYPTDLTIDCPGKADVGYCTTPRERPPPPSVLIDTPTTEEAEKWEFSKYLRKFFLREKIMGNEN